MTKEQLEKGKEIEIKISNIRESIKSIKSFKNDIDLGKTNRLTIELYCYDKYDHRIEDDFGKGRKDGLSFLDEYLDDELNRILDMIESKANKEISKLEKELSSI